MRGDVSGETAGVNEAPVLEVPTGIDHNVYGRAVLGPQPGRVVVQHLTGEKPPQEIIDDRPVLVKVDDVLSHEFFAVVAQQVELGLVDPEDGAVGPDPVHRNRGVLEEIGELLLSTPKLGSGLFEIVDIHRGSHPVLQLSLGVSQRDDAGQHPAVYPVVPAIAELHLERLLQLEAPAPLLLDSGDLVGVVEMRPAPLVDLPEARSGVLLPGTVDVENAAARVGQPQETGRHLAEGSVPLLEWPGA